MIQGIWVVLIIILLLMSVIGFSGAFLGVIIVFYVPMILGILYMIWELIGWFWFSVALMCLCLYIV